MTDGNLISNNGDLTMSPTRMLTLTLTNVTIKNLIQKVVSLAVLGNDSHGWGTAGANG